MSSAIVIGGGPAGSATAILLARGGWDVRLVEQHRFPREKVCGECLSDLGRQVLGRMGLEKKIDAAGGVRLRRTILYSQSGAAAELVMPGEMMGLSRGKLDLILLEEARNGGVRVECPARAETIREREVVVRWLGDNRVEILRADWVVLADGKRGLVARPARPAGTGELGVKAHFEGVDGAGDAIELFGVRGHYVGVAPIEGGRWNVAYAVPAGRVKQCGGDLQKLFEEMLIENVMLGKRFQSTKRVGEWMVSALPRFGVMGNWPTGVVMVGNAAAAIEPIGGEGMGLALRSGEMAAQAMVLGKEAVLNLQGGYQKLWGTRRWGCRVGGVVMSTPIAARTAVALLKGVSGLGTMAMKMVGKRAR